jgi:hypothetical protein
VSDDQDPNPTVTHEGDVASGACPKTIARTYKATDASGNMATCTQTITVQDTMAPVLSGCPADTAYQCLSQMPAPATVTAVDNCDGAVAVSFSEAQSDPGSSCNNTITRTWTARDVCGNVASCTQTITVNDTTAPDATITGPPSGAVFAVGTPVDVTGTFTDNSCGDHTATWSFDGSPVTGTVNEVTGEVTALVTFSTPGVYQVTLAITDNCGNSVTAANVNDDPAMVVIYDPNGGFVTGGGWITSPAGAYPADPELTGKANFGFVSKYQKGATVPSGQTEFQFRVANFNFHSTVYEWLVVSGPKAQYKGSGTVNGVGNYSFLLTATDGQATGGGGTDKFRIKIWDQASGAILYDNRAVAGDDIDRADPQELGGGSIVIHRGK